MNPELKYECIKILLGLPLFVLLGGIFVVSSLNRQACGLILVFSGIMLLYFFVLYFWPGLMRRLSERNWEARKEGALLGLKLKVEPEFEKVEGERVLIPLCFCVIRMFGLASMSYEPRDVAVTNKRILIGFVAFGVRESFGDANLWHPSITNPPKVESKYRAISLLLGRDLRIDSIILGKDRESVKIIAFYKFLPALFEIYHPRAREIYEIFSR
ncbi:MAG: hypothetical protein NT157_03655 [Candidatus Micrarchaeota archaeon]|nr:hypothetical protein [Candidatus Micrarchaeota archaeon]